MNEPIRLIREAKASADRWRYVALSRARDSIISGELTPEAAAFALDVHMTTMYRHFRRYHLMPEGDGRRNPLCRQLTLNVGDV